VARVSVRRCRSCGRELELEAFALHSSCAGGRRHVCRRCDRDRQRARRVALRDVAAAELAAQHFAHRSRHGWAGVLARPTVAQVARRHGAACCRCGGAIELARSSSRLGLTLDHYPVAVADGGLHELENLRLAHRGCNSRAAVRDSYRRRIEELPGGARQERLELELREEASGS
jgi:hypothetical protein